MNWRAIFVVGLLLAVPAQADPRTDSMLVTGARAKLMHVVQKALEDGADVNAGDATGRTALMWAAFQGNRPMAQLLLDRGASIDARDASGRTALIWAVIVDRGAMVDVLLGKGADLSIADDDGATAADLAEREGHTEIAELLAKAGAPTQ